MSRFLEEVVMARKGRVMWNFVGDAGSRWWWPSNTVQYVTTPSSTLQMTSFMLYRFSLVKMMSHFSSKRKRMENITVLSLK